MCSTLAASPKRLSSSLKTHFKSPGDKQSSHPPPVRDGQGSSLTRAFKQKRTTTRLLPPAPATTSAVAGRVDDAGDIATGRSACTPPEHRDACDTAEPRGRVAAELSQHFKTPAATTTPSGLQATANASAPDAAAPNTHAAAPKSGTDATERDTDVVKSGTDVITSGTDATESGTTHPPPPMAPERVQELVLEIDAAALRDVKLRDLALQSACDVRALFCPTVIQPFFAPYFQCRPE